ncbi:hypothetical protein KIN20_023172 [Parelaphostrongylus tenuis]|uniref:Uncharacterized protein n=1 Tax=Parelaphostrongylus tenuis TaxID=148309 RepID=A0AAD5QVV7_PARTN|nr:hypothetical protein KIN20_023172 [Parelaphostrongylus tenuis]
MGSLTCVNPFGIFQDFLADCFYKYGLFISKHPRAFAIGPLVLTCILATGLLNVKMELICFTHAGIYGLRQELTYEGKISSYQNAEQIYFRKHDIDVGR